MSAADGPLAIRPATEADVPAAKALVERAYAVHLGVVDKPPAPLFDDYAAHQAAGHLFVAGSGGTIAGLVVLIDAADHLLLDNVAVDPATQGRGVGRALIAFAEAAARARGHHEVRLYTQEKMAANIALYRRLGFVETHRAVQDGFPRVFMTKRL
ncbi:GNAT family N-acetyltransferase [Segnochrobactrum spirostomi]|uniref:GNAT family N-acetyltransferase n=1 Tax=Segnochrobactrum spirostomi TaxID=2608987 RepID=A0A6A7XYZ8_9HYPH|nr:GNAT family N-acetyltransferase [Segnochrobactrum spirostomi]MQT11675.1 GNAT family N-acetyltransferase [Segnochrobactrum spirostomi]